MTKAHRKHLYVVLATGLIAVVIVALAFMVRFLETDHRTRGTDAGSVVRDPGAMAPVRQAQRPLPPQPGPAVGNTIPASQTGILAGWVLSADTHSIVILTSSGTSTIQIAPDTTVELLNAAAIDPTQHRSVSAASIPLNALAHVTLKKGTKDMAASITIVKNHD